MSGIRGGAILALALAAGGCGGVPFFSERPLVGPAVTTAVRHRGGPPLRGDAGAARADGAVAVRVGDPADAFRVVVTLAGLESLDENALDGLGERARLVASTTHGTTPLLAAPRLLAGARVGVTSDPRAAAEGLLRGDLGRAVRTAELRGALPRGAMASFEASRDAPGGPLPGEEGHPPARDRVAIEVYRVAEGADVDAIEVAIAVERVVGEPRALEDEIAVFERRPLGDAHLVAIFPSPFGGPATAIAAVVAVDPAPAPQGVGAAAHRAAYAACVADLARDDAYRLALARTARPSRAGGAEPPRRPAPPDLSIARRALLESRTRRGTLVALGYSTGARFVEDVALAAEDPLIEALAARIAKALAGWRGRGDDPALGWLLERAALETVAANLAVEKIRTPALRSILVRRGGGLVGLPASFLAAVEASTDLADFDRRLAHENRALLDDPDAAIRARSHDWLAEHGLVPPGYDPLATTAERRAALAKEAPR